MSMQALNKASSFKRLSVAVVAACGALASSAALAGNAVGLYGGAMVGPMASQRTCDTASSCDRAATGGKLFGGYYVTPNVAAEINYFYFGGLDKAYDGPESVRTGIATTRESARALSANINWNIELFDFMTNHIKLGWAWTQRNQTVTYAAGNTEHLRDYSGSPYLGLGISIPMNRVLRLQTGFDYLINGKSSHYLFGVGFTGEF